MSEQPTHPASNLSRRDLFRTVGLATGGAMLLSLPTMLSGFVSPAGAALRKGATSMTNTTLELDGQFGGFLSTVDGGGVFADILNEPLGQDMIQRKRPGPVRFQDIVIDIPLHNVEKALSSWIAETLTKNAAPKTGTIVYADFNFNEVKRLEFSGALLTEIALPDADAQDSSKNAASLTLRLTPQSTRLAGGKGKMASASVAKTKQILSSNFRFNVQGLEKACGRILSVEPIVLNRAVAQTPAGQEKFRQSSAAGALDCSKVTITLPEADAGPFYAWFDDMVIKGRPGTERAGLLEWLDLTLKNTVASAQLGNLGIVRYEPDPVASGGERRLGQVQVDMYCETINLTL